MLSYGMENLGNDPQKEAARLLFPVLVASATLKSGLGLWQMMSEAGLVSVHTPISLDDENVRRLIPAIDQAPAVREISLGEAFFRGCAPGFGAAHAFYNPV